MPRLPYLNEKTARVTPATLDAVLKRRKGKLVNLDGVLLYSDPLTRGWNALLGAIRTEMSLEPRLTEITIVRVGILNGAQYEVHQHGKVALGLGVTQKELDAIAAWESSTLFSASERAALAYADAMTRNIRVPEAIFTELRQHFDERQIVELTATIGAYNMVSRLLEALEVTTEGEK